MEMGKPLEKDVMGDIVNITERTKKTAKKHSCLRGYV